MVVEMADQVAGTAALPLHLSLVFLALRDDAEGDSGMRWTELKVLPDRTAAVEGRVEIAGERRSSHGALS